MGLLKLSPIFILAFINFSHIQVESKYIKHGNDLRITNGGEAVPHSLPFLAAIKTEVGGRQQLCAGTLISQKSLLTAARCLYGVEEAEIIFGAHDLSANETTQVAMSVSKSSFVIHQDFNISTMHQDIALILFDEPIELNDNIKLVQLPDVSDNFHDYADEEGIIAGWGKTKDVANTTSAVLQSAKVVVIPFIDCEIDNVLNLLDLSQMCTSGVKTINICLGDSGGPLIIDGLQVGIASYGSDFGCEVGLPGVYTRTVNYLLWIRVNSPS